MYTYIIHRVKYIDSFIYHTLVSLCKAKWMWSRSENLRAFLLSLLAIASCEPIPYTIASRIVRDGVGVLHSSPNEVFVECYC